MKTRLKQYLIVWLKFFVMSPLLVSGYIFRCGMAIYMLFAAALLGQTKDYADIFDNEIDILTR